jgi:glyoxylase-like metal-dependent hydrolase (beta-lactamase superfamily II)
MMKRFATEVQRFAAESFYWEKYSDELKTVLSSAGFREESEVVLIDPVPLTMSAMNKVVGPASRAFTLLTNANHERAALSLRENMRIPILAHEDARAEMEIDANDYFKDGDELPAGLVAVHVPGVTPGETAFYTSKNGGIVAVGDALVNLDPEQGMAFLPDKYSKNPKQSRQSLRKLLKLEFEMMTFAHGQPIVSGARKRLESLLENSGSRKFKAVETP